MGLFCNEQRKLNRAKHSFRGYVNTFLTSDQHLHTPAPARSCQPFPAVMALHPTSVVLAAATPTATDTPVMDEEFYSSWSLFLVCMLLILSLWTSYYLQIKRIRAVHETLVSIFAGMFVGMIVRLAPVGMVKEMLVCHSGWNSPDVSI